MGKTFTPEQKAEYKKLKRQEAKEKLDEAVNQIRSEAGWQQWLRTRARFHKYSFHNTLLIAAQTRDWETPPTNVAGAKKWLKDFDRKIKKGEKALRIMAPIMVTKKDDDGNEIIDPKTEKPVKIPAFYKMVPVFDVQQTEGDTDLPLAPFTPIEGDDHLGLMADIYDYAAKHGIDLDISDDISINANVRQSVRQIAERRAKLLNPEEDGPLLTAGEREVIKEAITFVVLTGLGFDPSQESVPHIAAWQEQDTYEIDALKMFAGYIDKEAKEIESLLGGPMKVEAASLQRDDEIILGDRRYTVEEVQSRRTPSGRPGVCVTITGGTSKWLSDTALVEKVSA